MSSGSLKRDKRPAPNCYRLGEPTVRTIERLRRKLKFKSPAAVIRHSVATIAVQNRVRV